MCGFFLKLFYCHNLFNYEILKNNQMSLNFRIINSSYYTEIEKNLIIFRIFLTFKKKIPCEEKKNNFFLIIFYLFKLIQKLIIIIYFFTATKFYLKKKKYL